MIAKVGRRHLGRQGARRRPCAPLGFLAVAAALWLATALQAHAVQPAVYVQLGHSDSVMAVAISPNGRLLASGSFDNTVKLWDTASGRELMTLSEASVYVPRQFYETAGVYSVAFSPDGLMLATGNADHSVKLWDIASGRELRTLTGHARIVNSVAFAPDGRTLASASLDGTAKIWDVGSGRELRTLSGHTSVVLAVAFSPDGRTLATASGDHAIKLWDAASGAELRTLSGHSDMVNTVTFSPDGSKLASGSEDRSIIFWDAASGRIVRKLGDLADRIESVAFSPDGHTLVAAQPSHGVGRWDVASGRKLPALRGNPGESSGVAFSTDGRSLASAGRGDKSVTLWDTSSDREPRILTGETQIVESVAFSPDGRILASGYGHQGTILWDPATGRPLRTLSGGTTASLVFSSDGSTIAGSTAKGVTFWDTASGRELGSLGGEFWSGLAFSPDGGMLALASSRYDQRNFLTLWDLDNGRVLRALDAHEGAVMSAAFSPDGKLLASGGFDHLVKLWDPGSGQLVRTLSGHPLPITSVAFSPDGRTLASSGGPMVKLWDVESGRELFTLEHLDVVSSVRFSPDGISLASTSYDHSVKVWDVASGRELRTLGGHKHFVKSAAFSPDGRTLVSGGWDGILKVWDVASGREMASAVAFKDGATLVTTPQGYYDYDGAAAEQNLLVRTGSDPFEVTDIRAYRETFLRPDLVRRSLQGRLLPAALVTLASIKPAPGVSIVNAPAEIDGEALDLQVRLADRGGGVGSVRVFLNGSAVSDTDARGLEVVGAGDGALRSIPLLLVSGRNEIGVIAYNRDGSAYSIPATVNVTTKFAPRRKPQLHALVVGIDHFRNPALELRYSVADATAIAEMLRKRAGPLFDKVEVELLTTAEATTREALLAALGRYRAIGADDVFVFYAASHGTVANEDLASREYFLISSNVGLASDDALRHEAISQSDLKKAIAGIPATKKVILLDTCQAGALGDALALTTRGASDQAAINILSAAVGSTVLSAATSQEQALEGMNGHGVFTWVVLKGLDGGADLQKNGYVSTLDLASYVGDQVPKVASEVFKREQFPNLHNAGQSFPLVSSR